MNHAKTWNPVATRAVLSGGAIREGRFVVKGASAGVVIEGATASTVPPLGVSLTAVLAAGESLDIVCVPGMIAKVEAGGSVSHGDLIAFNSAGEGIAATDGAEYICGRALEAASDGEYFACQLWSPAKLLEQAVTFAALTDSSAGTANDTIQALPDPTDTPATADALRDDLVAVHWPAIRNNFADLATKINEIRTVLRNAKLVA
jgi:hypothetical protein